MSIRQNVVVNGKTYALRSPMLMELQEEFSEQYRTQGQQRPFDRKYISQWRITTMAGHGQKTFNDVPPESGIQPVWQSKAETRYEGHVYPPLKQNAETSPGDGSTVDHLRAWINYKGGLWGLFEPETSNPVTNSVARTFSGSAGTWGGGGGVASLDGVGEFAHVFGITVHKGTMFVVALNNVFGSNDLRTLYSTDGVTWNMSTDAGLASNTAYVANDHSAYNTHIAKIHSHGSTLIVSYRAQASTSIIAYKSTDSGANWTSLGTTGDSVGKVGGIASYFDTSGNSAPVICTADALYYLDLTANTTNLLYDLAGEQDGDNGNGMCAWQGSLYVPTHGSGSSILQLTIDNNGAQQVARVGPNEIGNGLPSAWQGKCFGLYPANEWLFGVFSGTSSSENAVIMAFDGTRWHMVMEWGTVNQVIPYIITSANDDNTMRLHFAVDRTDYSRMYNIKYPLTFPGSTTAETYESTLTIELPTFSGGLPDVDGTLLYATVDADLTATNENLTLKYGVDGASSTNVTLGTFTSTTKSLNFPTGSTTVETGVSFKNVNIQLSGVSSSAGSLDLRALTIYYIKKPAARYIYTLPIDIVATARQRRTTAQQVITEIKSWFTTYTQITLDVNRTTTYVTAIAPIEIQEINNRVRARNSPVGLVMVKLLELI